MKTMKYVVMLLGCLPFLTACSNNEENNEIVTSVPLEIQLSGVDTRSIIEGTTLPMQTSFGIYGTTDDKTIMSSINNLSVFYDGKCELEKDVLVNTSFYVKAYYPYSKEVEHGIVYLDVRDQVDFLYGRGVNSEGKQQLISKNHPQADIVFKHALSRITFKVRHTERIDEDFKLSSIHIAPVYMTATYNVLTQELTPDQINEPTFKLDVIVGKEFSSFDLLMIPIEANSDRGIILYDTNDKGQWAKLPEGEWKAGQQYTYEVTFDNNGVKISEAVITAWTTSTEEESEITDDNLVTN